MCGPVGGGVSLGVCFDVSKTQSFSLSALCLWTRYKFSATAPVHACLPTAMLPTVMVTGSPSNTVKSIKHFLLSVVLVLVSYYSNRK